MTKVHFSLMLAIKSDKAVNIINHEAMYTVIDSQELPFKV